MDVTDEDSLDLVFHGKTYNLSVTISNESLEPTIAIDLEDIATNEAWSSELTSSYVESITSKTGSFKRFSVLTKMLFSAMRQESDTVALDLLTYSDLEALKAKKTGQPTPPPSGVSTKANKRYLILTYVVEFDRVHYPLPLTQVEGPTVSALQRQVRRLRRELSAFRKAAGMADTTAMTASGLSNSNTTSLVSNVTGMQREMESYKAKIAELASQNSSLNDSLREAQSRLRAAQDTAAANDASLEKLRLASRSEIKRLKLEIADLREKLGNTENALAAASEVAITAPVKRDSEIVAALKETNEQLRERVKELTRQLTAITSAGSVSQYQTGHGPGSVSSRRSLSASSRVSATPSQSKLIDRLASSPLARPHPRAPSTRSTTQGKRPTSASSVGSRSTTGSYTSAPERRAVVRPATASPYAQTSGSRQLAASPMRSNVTGTAAAATRNTRPTSARTRDATILVATKPSSVAASPRSARPTSASRANPYSTGMNSVASVVNDRPTSASRSVTRVPTPPTTSAAARMSTASSSSHHHQQQQQQHQQQRSSSRSGGARADEDYFVVPPAPSSAAPMPRQSGGLQPLSKPIVAAVAVGTEARSAASTTSGDIAEIDARLAQLQAFLKQAKSQPTASR